MNISGSTQIVVNGKKTRVCGKVFNRALKDAEVMGISPTFCDEEGNEIVPSKGIGWGEVSKMIRAGKKVQARSAASKK